MKRIIIISVLSILGLFLLFVLGAIFETASQGNQTNWSKGFRGNGTSPYDFGILSDRLKKDFLGNDNVKSIEETIVENEGKSPYQYDEVLDEYEDFTSPNFYPENYKDHYNYFLIGREINLDKYDSRAILEHVMNGNVAFFASHSITGFLSEKFSLEYSHDFLKTDSAIAKSHGLPATLLRLNDVSHDIKSYDERAEILLRKNKSDTPLLIRYQYGMGYVYFCSVPELFTNLYLLDKNVIKRSESVLSYLPERKTYLLFGYSRRNNEPNKDSSSSASNNFSFFMKHPPLKWGLLIIIWTLVAYFILRIKRNQRMIPRKNPVENSTLQFVGTIGQLYLTRGTHYQIAQKIVHYFYDWIRRKYYVQFAKVDEGIIKKISEKSGIEYQRVHQLFNYLQEVDEADQIDQRELIDLYKMIEDFKQDGK